MNIRYLMLSLLFALLAISGCKLVSKTQLEELKNPQNPLLVQARTIYHERIVPYAEQQAKLLVPTLQTVIAQPQFEQACSELGYRSQPAFPCNFWVQVTGEIESIQRGSRIGTIVLKTESVKEMPDHWQVSIQVGPVFRGTSLRDAFSEIHYSDFNDQTLFGDFGKALNAEAIASLPADSQMQPGTKVTVYGIITSWQELDLGRLQITPARIVVGEADHDS